MELLQEQQLKKDRKKYFEWYNNQPEIKQKRKLARLEKLKERWEKEKEASSKNCGAESIKILMNLKQYTELNKEKMKLWADFNWTLKDCNEEVDNITAIMKLEQVANKLIKDYWETAKQEKVKGKSWNSLDYEEQQRLIKYWGREKARVENGYVDELERLELKGREHEKKIEISKYHEERGKIKCECWWCEERNIIKKEVKSRVKKEIEEAQKGIDEYWGVGEKVEEWDEEF